MVPKSKKGTRNE